MEKKEAPTKRNARRTGRSSAGEPSPASAHIRPFLAGASLSDTKMWAALRSLLRMQILEAIIARPGIDARMLADALESSAPRLYYHIKILVRSGLVVEESLGERRRARGPEAAVYRARIERFPTGFLDADPRADVRRQLLVRELANQGLTHALPQIRAERATAVFRHEVMLESERTQIQTYIASIVQILDAARHRRHTTNGLGGANAFVGICISPVTEPTLPDGLLDQPNV